MNNLRRPLLTLGACALVATISSITTAQTTVISEIAPTGKLRVGMNAGNATLVTRAADGSVGGLSVDLGKFIAEKLGLEFEPVVYPAAAAFTASFGKGEWDIIVTGRNPLAAKLVDFMPDVILRDYVFLAAPGREFSDAGQVDRAGIKIGVPRNASADAFLSRRLKSAELVRVAGDIATAVDLLRAGKVDVYAAGTDSALNIADRLPGTRIIGTFQTVAFAVSIPKGRSPEAQSKITQIVNDAKRAGIVQKAIQTSGLKGVRVAPD
jgi:polar amino acid transport system substrate-binding protein